MNSEKAHDSDDPEMEGPVCPLPLRDYPEIVLGHGGGGKLSNELIEHIFLPAFDNATLAALGDAAVLSVGDHRLAFSTDSFVVRPLFFPGGCIGDLAVNGTVNDLAMRGATPLYLSAGFIVEEGFPLESLRRVAESMGAAARVAGVAIVTGDTKVVERGHGDGCYINTAGIGLVPGSLDIGPQRASPGDAILISGSIGDHGMAIMSVREGLQFEAAITSDSAALHGLVAKMLEVSPTIRVLRDPTRGGIAASLNEIATAADVGMVLHEPQIPVHSAVQSACELLGLDPMLVANEGKLIAVVPAADADVLLETMRNHPLGQEAAIIGHVTRDHPGMVVVRTAIGATRVLSLAVGEQLPRIC